MSKGQVVVLSADYEEYKPETYRGIVVHGKNCQYERINTGDFEADLESATKKYADKGYKVLKSSSVDHYRTDLKRTPAIKATIDAEWVAEMVAMIIYNQGKAKILNVLESQLPQETITDREKMRACKDITVDIIGNIARDTADFIRDMLDDWEQEVETGGTVSEEEAAETEKVYEEVQRIIR